MIRVFGQVSSLLPCDNLNFQRHLLFWADILSWSREATFEFLQDWAQKRNVNLKRLYDLIGKTLFNLDSSFFPALFDDATPPSICQELYDFLHASAVCFCKSNIIYFLAISVVLSMFESGIRMAAQTLLFGRQVKFSAIFKILQRKIMRFSTLLRPLLRVHHSSASVLIACRR